MATAWLWSTVLLSVAAIIAVAVMAPGRSAPPTRGLVWLLFLGSSVHVASTGWLYTLPDVRAHVRRHPVRYAWAPVGLMAVAAVVAAATSPSILAWLLLPYFAWQFLHFQKQNLGIGALAASSVRVTALRRTERRALEGAGVAGIAGLMAHPGLLQLPDGPGVAALFTASQVAFVGSVAVGVTALVRRPIGDRPAGFSVAYLLALFFSLPVFVFASPYAAVGGMTVAHGLQYLLLVGMVAGGERSPNRRPRLTVLFLVAALGGAALSSASHLHGSPPAGRILFGAYLGAVMAHFVVDAGLWRLRDPFPRDFLGRYLPGLVPPSPAGRSGPTGPSALAADRSSADVG